MGREDPLVYIIYVPRALHCSAAPNCGQEERDDECSDEKGDFQNKNLNPIFLKELVDVCFKYEMRSCKPDEIERDQ